MSLLFFFALATQVTPENCTVTQKVSHPTMHSPSWILPKLKSQLWLYKVSLVVFYCILWFLEGNIFLHINILDGWKWKFQELAKYWPSIVYPYKLPNVATTTLDCKFAPHPWSELAELDKGNHSTNTFFFFWSSFFYQALVSIKINTQ
jgi:hypothetical protein